MERYLFLNLNLNPDCQIPRFPARFPPSRTPPPPADHHRSPHHNAVPGAIFVMYLSHSAFKRILATYNFGFKHRNLNCFCLFSCNSSSMADESNNKYISPEVVELKDDGKSQIQEAKAKPLEKSTPSVDPPPPPPPEKPEPGDCCGSGCVRCVWDVYYEELDEYERLYKTDPKSSTNS